MDGWTGDCIKTPVSNSPLLPFLLLSLARQRNTPHTVQCIDDEYDYIIVGGGTAGSVVASRLSEKSCVNVLLLEAGPQPPLITEVPALFSSLLGTYVDWNISLVPQKHTAYAIKNGILDFHGGKMLGGTSNLNDNLYFRGNRKNYDDWEAQGAKGWNFDNVYPYFLKLEDNRNISFLQNGYHTVGGPITVESSRYVPELHHIFHKAATELGYKYVDSNGETQRGFSYPQFNYRDAQRCSTAKAYLVPVEFKPNLAILLNTMVTQVIIEGGRAIGVKLYREGKYQVVLARREVIVSAGVANTPKLLMLSGVGPRADLERLMIKVNADLPVGKNLQDHGYTSYFFTIDARHSNVKKLSDDSYIEEYINKRTGPLSAISLPALAFLNGLEMNPLEGYPTFHLFSSEMDRDYWKLILTPEIYKQLFKSIDDNAALYSCSISNNQPQSRGTVTLKSINPFDSPDIDTNYLDDPRDVKVFVDGLRVCKTLLNSEALQQAGAKPIENLMPGCEMYASSDEEYFSCYVRYIFACDWHLVGTCKMGNPDDLSTVVDPNLRVKHIENLRIVDASVMPIIPSAHTHIPTVMVAEKAADIIKASIDCWK